MTEETRRLARGALTMQHVEGLAVQQLVDALTRVGNNVRHRKPAVHGLKPHIGLGRRQTFQRLFGQHDPVSVPKDQRRAGRDQVEGVGQYEDSAVHAGKSSVLNPEAKSGVNSLGYLANRSRR